MHREDHQPSEDNNENERYSERSNYSPHYKRSPYNSGSRSGEYNRDYYRERDYNRDDTHSSYRPGGSGGHHRDRDYNRDEQRSGYRPGGGYNRDRDYNRDYNRDDQRGGYRPGGGYNRDRDYNRDHNRDDQRGGYRPGGGYNRDRDYNRDHNRDDQRGYRPGGGYSRDRDYNRDHNRDDQRGHRPGGGYRPGGGGGYRPGGGYQRSGGYQRDDRGPRSEHRQETYRPRPRPKAIFIQDSQFLLPDHDLNQEFQRAIGMAKGTITEVDARKKRGTIEIDGHAYKFEDERKRDYQRKYPIEKFLEREIQFAFWPTYSQKAAQYRKIDESPTIKIANLRRTLPDPNFVEIIGEVMMVEEKLFVLSIFSKSQKKKYLVTIMGSIVAETGDLIQMFGKLKDGGIHYSSHRLIPVGEDAVEARALAEEKAAELDSKT